MANDDAAKISQRVTTSEADRKFVDTFMADVDVLAGMVREMFEEHLVLLLSPVMRDLIANKAREVMARVRPLKGRLTCDNPCSDLTPWEPK